MRFFVFMGYTKHLYVLIDVVKLLKLYLISENV